MGRTSDHLSLLRSDSLKFQPQNMSCMPKTQQPFKNFSFRPPAWENYEVVRAISLKNIGRKNLTKDHFFQVNIILGANILDRSCERLRHPTNLFSLCWTFGVSWQKKICRDQAITCPPSTCVLHTVFIIGDSLHVPFERLLLSAAVKSCQKLSAAVCLSGSCHRARVTINEDD